MALCAAAPNEGDLDIMISVWQFLNGPGVTFQQLTEKAPFEVG